MKFREYITEVKDYDITYFESIVKEHFPSGSRLRYGRFKHDTLYSTWGNIKENRIPKHGQSAKVDESGDITIHGEVVSNVKDLYKMFKAMNKKMEYNDIEGVRKFGISFDEIESISGEMFNAVFNIEDYK